MTDAFCLGAIAGLSALSWGFVILLDRLTGAGR
jgi:hypothetical protein